MHSHCSAAIAVLICRAVPERARKAVTHASPGWQAAGWEAALRRWGPAGPGHDADCTLRAAGGSPGAETGGAPPAASSCRSPGPHPGSDALPGQERPEPEHRAGPAIAVPQLPAWIFSILALAEQTTWPTVPYRGCNGQALLREDLCFRKQAARADRQPLSNPI